ncbi:MbnP family protein [Luteirhabdus pelagi]|uniref:MbnP family protein n=1 Tax=Luteirhabdus pelagi TaxID=2792783 RepID=UPI00193AB3DE|nr:MbnP family protein [Luteirhabdus pelagi]
MKKVFLLLLFVAVLASCKSDDDSTSSALVQFQFSQNWDGTAVTASDIDNTVYTNENGEELKIARLRYLLSRFQLSSADGSNTLLNTYQLIDLSDASTMQSDSQVTVPEGTYTVSMIYGFNDEDNVDGAYADLNAASWNWPTMLGGGYHFLQFDGMYNVNSSEPKPFNFHNGTARVSEGVFESNFVEVDLGTITIDGDTTINIQMNIAEWFKNPNTWNLNELDTPLMPNYEAQIMMHENAQSVFSISQN